MTTGQRWLVGGIALIGVAAVIYYFRWQLEDEPPIRVHNGSLQIDTVAGQGSFKGENGDADDGDASYSHETAIHNASRVVYASVSPTSNATCSGNLTQARNDIVVTYHNDVANEDHEFTFKRGHIDSTYETKIRPIKDMTETAYRLTYGAGVSGHISKVELRGRGQPATCRFAAQDQVLIAICPSAACNY